MTLAVLIVYHDEGSLLTECLRSLLDSIQLPDEIHVYDNGSVIRAVDFIPTGAPVILTRSDRNSGPSYARNRLIEKAAADYVHFQDADDVFAPRFCHLVRSAIEQSQADLIINQVATFSDHGTLRERALHLNVLADHGDLVRFTLEHGLCTPSGTIRRSVLEQAGGFDESLWHNEDSEFYFRLALAGVRFSIIPEPTVLIRQRPDSLCRNDLRQSRGTLSSLHKMALLAPSAYRQYMVEQAAGLAVDFLRRNELKDADAALMLARSLGEPRFTAAPRPYRFLARTFGLRTAERVRGWYLTLPPGIRMRARRALA